jgi:hypothetical protein
MDAIWKTAKSTLIRSGALFPSSDRPLHGSTVRPRILWSISVGCFSWLSGSFDCEFGGALDAEDVFPLTQRDMAWVFFVGPNEGEWSEEVEEMLARTRTNPTRLSTVLCIRIPRREYFK